MLKFAFIVNQPGQSPETYSGTYENAESFNLVAATGDMEYAKSYVKKLADEGYSLFNFCGDFDDDFVAEVSAAVGADVKVRAAKYTPENAEKVEALEVFNRYGIVIVMRGVEEPADVVLECDDLYTHAIFVKDQEQANAAAQKLVADGVQDIELCSWFDTEKTDAVVAAIDGACAVGSCGL
ncbi:MAG: hypothetical protein HUJ79_04120 [Firmicutes bacterium]|nr:hypothetical protein [Bacillota bacterium]